MRHALKRIHLKWQAFGDRIRDAAWSGAMRLVGLSRRQRLALGGIGLAFFGVGIGLKALAADDMFSFANVGGAIGSYVLLMAAQMVMIAVMLELIICVLLTKLLIAVCSYQGFVTSDAVVTGWPLIRDLCNMFFIVVLLIIAFSTIIGYKEFDYKRYVPRLLLMAVLINFSKTLVGLLIDFSQVIMLTFVNGFKEAAFGNFVKAFGLDKVLSISDSFSTGQGYENFADTIGILISLLFATIMLMVVATILTMMLVYMTARIITLWVILIFSPLAFFIWALPPKLAKSVSSFSTKWWSQLGAWLSGGPIMAFFLWLTMAIVASKPNPFAKLMPVDPEMSAPMKLLSKAAESGNVANFVVATALLFVGLKQALEVGQAAGGMVGSAMQKIQSSGGPIGAGAVLGARVAGKAASKGVKMADQKYNISGKMGKGMLAQAGAWGKEGGLKGMLAMPLASMGAKVGGIGAQREKAAAEKLAGTTKFLPPEQYDDAIQAAKASGDKGTRAAAKKDEMLHRFDPGYRENMVQRRKQAEMEDIKNKNPGMSAADIEREATLRANRAYDSDTSSLMTRLQTDPDVGEDGEFRKKLKEQMASNPQLSPDLKGMRAEMQKKKLHEIPAAAYNSLDVGIEAYRNNGLIGANNQPVDGWEAKAEEMAKKLNPEARERFMAVGHALQTPTGQAALLANANGATPTNPSGLSRARMDRQADGSFVVSDAAGKVTGSFGGAKERRSADIRNAVASAAAGAPGGPGSVDVDRFAGQLSQVPTTAQQAALSNAFSSGAYSSSNYSAPGGAISAAAAASMGKAQTAGVPASIAFQFDGSGGHQSEAFREAHLVAATAALSDPAADPVGAVNFVMNMDTDAIAQGGDVAGVVAQAMKGKIVKLVEAAEKQGPTSEARVKQVLQAVERAMSSAQGRMAGGVGTGSDTDLSDLGPEMGNKLVKQFLEEKKKKSS